MKNDHGAEHVNSKGQHNTYNNGELAMSKGVPQLNGLVTTARYNLSVVHRECNTQDILKSKKYHITLEWFHQLCPKFPNLNFGWDRYFCHKVHIFLEKLIICEPLPLYKSNMPATINARIIIIHNE